VRGRLGTGAAVFLRGFGFFSWVEGVEVGRLGLRRQRLHVCFGIDHVLLRVEGLLEVPLRQVDLVVVIVGLLLVAPESLVVIQRLVILPEVREVGGRLGRHLVDALGSVRRLAHLQVAHVQVRVVQRLVALVQTGGVGLADARTALPLHLGVSVGGLVLSLIHYFFLRILERGFGSLLKFGVIRIDGL